MRHFRLAIALVAWFMLSSACSSELAAVRNLEIASPRLEGIAAGSHRGAYAYGNFEYVVLVRVAAGRIEGIEILANRGTPHAKKAEAVIPRIIAAQGPHVEAISGATTTSKALMKAVENALSAAPRT